MNMIDLTYARVVDGNYMAGIHHAIAMGRPTPYTLRAAWARGRYATDRRLL